MGDERDVAGFLETKGAIGVLTLLGDHEDGLLFGELESQLDIAPATLSNLLQKGTDAQLLAETQNVSDHGNAQRYTLTEYGSDLHAQLVEIGADETYEELAALREKLAEQRVTLLDWVETEFTTSKRELYHQDRSPQDQ